MAGNTERHLNTSGLTDQEAREFHGYFMQFTMLYIAIACVAHLLMWMWRPWIGG